MSFSRGVLVRTLQSARWLPEDAVTGLGTSVDLQVAARSQVND
jgi:hypothetical protein